MMGIHNIKEQLPQLPMQSGIYKMLDLCGNILYVGKANNIRDRVSSYIRPTDSIKTSSMLEQVVNVDFIVTKNEEEALLLESRLIKSLQPKYNITLKDDKTYPFIAIDRTCQFPRIFKTRNKYFNKKVGIEFFGPFSSAHNTMQTILAIQKIYQLRSCNESFFKKRTRPCIEYQIKRCTAPCVGKICAKDYLYATEQAIKILSGDVQNTISLLSQTMKKFSLQEEYEKAGIVRDRILALEKLTQINNFNIDDPGDYIALFRNEDSCCVQIFRICEGNNFGNLNYFFDNINDVTDSEILSTVIINHYLIKDNSSLETILTLNTVNNKQLLEKMIFDKYNKKISLLTVKEDNHQYKFLESVAHNANIELDKKTKKQLDNKTILDELSKIFNLDKNIRYIEIFDNSHTSGGFPVGAIVAATQDGFDKSKYLIFYIKNFSLSDDYSMLREVLTRRFSPNFVKNRSLPDLLLIDGGKGHLSTALDILNKMNISVPCICISKGKERRASKELFHMRGRTSFSIKNNEQVFRYIQRLRDEAHRFAISRHRKRRDKACISL